MVCVAALPLDLAWLLGAALALEVKARYPELFKGFEGAFLVEAIGFVHELSNTVVEEGGGNREEPEGLYVLHPSFVLLVVLPLEIAFLAQREAAVAISASLDVAVLA